MSNWLYLAALLASLAGLHGADYRWRLAWYHDRRATFLSLSLAVALFLLWDMLGIGTGIFFIGDTAYLSGIRLAPELPLEEPFFLLLLCYTALLLYRWIAHQSEPGDV